MHNYRSGHTRSQNVSHTIRTFDGKPSSQLTVFLSGFGAFLESEMKFSKLLVQPPHYLATCAHYKKFLILLNKLRLHRYIHATDYVHLSAVSYIIIYYRHVAQDV